MKAFDKFSKFLRFNDADDESETFAEEYEETTEETYPDEDGEAEEEEQRAPTVSLWSKKKATQEEEDEEEDGSDRVIPFYGKKESENVRVIKPQTFNEAQVVADCLKEGQTIVVNLEGIETSEAQRIIDFIGGASFAVDGSLKAISNKIFIVAPGNIEVTGDLRDEIVGENTFSPQLMEY